MQDPGHAGREGISVDLRSALLLFGPPSETSRAPEGVATPIQLLDRTWRGLHSGGGDGGGRGHTIYIYRGAAIVGRTAPPFFPNLDLDGGGYPFDDDQDSFRSAMITTNLDYLLRRRLGVDHVVMAGEGTDTVIESTARDAADMGYTVTLVTDATFTSSPQAQAAAEYVLQELQTGLRSPPPTPPCKGIALLVIDVQYYCASRGNGMLHDDRHSGDPYFYDRIDHIMVPNIKRLQEEFRAKGMEVMFTTIESLTGDGRDASLDYKISNIQVLRGSRDAHVLDEVGPVGDEIRFPKTSASVFMSTNIDYVLRNLGIHHVVCVGMITNQCVESSARDAYSLGYQVTVVSDATTAHTREDQEAAEKSLSRFGRVITTDQLIAELPSKAPGTTRRRIKVALLRTEGTEKTYGRGIVPMFRELFSAACKDVVVEMDEFDAKSMVYPTDWDHYDGFLIPGSASSAYDEDPWIAKLCEVIRTLHQQRRRTVGVCFGHQVIAQALGGKVIRNPQGLSWGLRSFDATEQGQARFSSHHSLTYSLLYHHNDIVSGLPKGAESLGADPRCPVHGMVVGESILTVQGHPEFDTPSGREVLRDILQREGNPVDGVMHTPDSDLVASVIVNHWARQG